jgi:hypothetical protein
MMETGGSKVITTAAIIIYELLLARGSRERWKNHTVLSKWTQQMLPSNPDSQSDHGRTVAQVTTMNPGAISLQPAHSKFDPTSLQLFVAKKD